MGDAHEERLIAKLKKIEALFVRPATPGERVAAENARQRIRHRLEQLERSERPIEFRFSFPDAWSQSLFIALLRRYGLTPYRYSGQRRTTVMTRVTTTFVNETLWPEFRELNATLQAHLESVTKRIIAYAIDQDDSEIDLRPSHERAGDSRASAEQGRFTLE
ncbi:MAG: hypothetical protein HY652_10825 [Acidobacteria bacterium]|nr:hypothetical protein [Acidobacteriota bacterium]